MSNDITPQTFLETVFPPDLLLPDERPVVAYPSSFTSSATGERVDYYRQFHPTDRTRLTGHSSYFCVSTVEKQRARQVKKRLADVRTAFVLVLDDIGTKSEAPAVLPSYILETSRNRYLRNYQWGYLLEPYDVSTPEGQHFYDTVLYSMAMAGHNDPGFRSASRLARLPGSHHRTGFVARITEWRPADRTWHLPDLFERFSVPMVTPRKPAALEPGRYTALGDVTDSYYQWLVRHWGVFGHNDQWVHIDCPWRSDHTDGQQGPTSTGFSPDGYGTAGRGFKCLHGHCADRDMLDFTAWINAQMNNSKGLYDAQV